MKFAKFLHNIWWINIGLLIFNMMPIYPLDGGQILRSLLWFIVGRANSLLAASIIGFFGVGLLVLLAICPAIHLDRHHGGVHPDELLERPDACAGAGAHRQNSAPRRDSPVRPAKAAPPLGELWRCGKCGKPFDMFATRAQCPHCGTQFSVTQCMDCGTASPDQRVARTNKLIQSSALNAREIKSRTACFGFLPS